MQNKRRSIILGVAFFATLATSTATQAAAGPPMEMHVAPATAAAPPSPSPYQEGYSKGISEGYREGQAQALKHCEDTVGWPQWPSGAYGVGYSDGYMLGWGRGIEDGKAKYCRPS
ncbi:hypothetical protein HD596_010928 [Nonomuraea jabiensis]|uniref:Uncharacterized protein n=1 Tax=Nonomuraea jabiensis TaxID=882448 RepID=A0A7W9GHZ2_9ACTN|nr:hypothetical protein [Nonomuraea jabiensis]